MNLTENAKYVLENRRYLQRNSKDEITETPDQMIQRIAKKVASVETKDKTSWAKKFYEFMSKLDFLPNSPILFNFGSKGQQHAAACHVLDIEDSMDSIFKVLDESAKIFKYGGGVGYNFGKLRPKDAVLSTGGTSTGPISFMEVYDSMVQAVRSGGKRRGAMMACLDINHPDIMEFITCKDTEGKLSNMNISVMVDDAFMQAVEEDSHYWLINPQTKKRHKKARAREVFELICKQAWKNGEPGILFYDSINKDDATPDLGPICATNPCLHGDTLIAVADERKAVTIRQLAKEGKDVQIYCYDGSNNVIRTGKSPRCTRESADIYKLILNDGSVLFATPDHKMRRDDFTEVELKDLKRGDSLYPFNKTQSQVAQTPKYFGKADVYNLTVDDHHNYAIITNPSQNHSGIIVSNCAEQPLKSHESCILGSINLSHFVKDGEIAYKSLLEAVKLGVRFLDNSIDAADHPTEAVKEATCNSRKIGIGVMGFADMLTKLKVPYNSDKAVEIAEELMKFVNDEAFNYSVELGKEKGSFPLFDNSIYKDKVPALRNAARSTLAPTGTLAIIANCSGGIEPLFRLAFVRNVDDKQLVYGNEEFEKIAKEIGFYSERLMQRIADDGNLANIDGLPQNVKEIFATSDQIPHYQHVRMQAAFQSHCDSGVSKTLNLSSEATKNDVEEVFLQAWRSGIKGTTIYRAGSRDKEILVAPPKTSEQMSNKKGEVTGITRTMKTAKCGNLRIVMNYDENTGELNEIIPMLGKSGGCTRCLMEALGRILSVGIREKLTPEEIVDQLTDLTCQHPTTKMHSKGGDSFTSCPDAIAQAIADREGKNKWEIAHNGGRKSDQGKTRCTKCGDLMEIVGGCEICPSCGNSGGCS